MLRRIGRPGLVGMAARTAVVAGTATAVSGSVARHQQKKDQEQYEQQQYEAQQQQAAMNAAAQQAVAQQQAAAPAAPAGGTDVVAELQKLADEGTKLCTTKKYASGERKLTAALKDLGVKAKT